MRRTAKRAIGLAAWLPIVVALGCTGSEVIRTGNGQLVVSLGASPSGAGRFESAVVGIAQVSFRPTDPAADAALGDEPLIMLPQRVNVDLAQGGVVVGGTVPVNEGTYRVTRIRMEPLRLQDFQVPPPNPPNCIDAFDLIPGPNDSGLVSPFFPINIDFTNEGVFTVIRGGQSTLRINLDGPALSTLFVSAFVPNCQTSCNRTGQSPIPPPCFSAFAGLTANQLRPLFSFN